MLSIHALINPFTVANLQSIGLSLAYVMLMKAICVNMLNEFNVFLAFIFQWLRSPMAVYSQFSVGLAGHGNKLGKKNEKKTAHIAFDEDSNDCYEMVFAILRL